jgi:hypothetical protein
LTVQRVIGGREIRQRGDLAKRGSRSSVLAGLKHRFRLAHPHFRHQRILAEILQIQVVDFPRVGVLLQFLVGDAQRVERIGAQRRVRKRLDHAGVVRDRRLAVPLVVFGFAHEERRLVRVLALGVFLDHRSKRFRGLGVHPLDAGARQRVLAPAKIQVGILNRLELRMLCDHYLECVHGLLVLLELQHADP